MLLKNGIKNPIINKTRTKRRINTIKKRTTTTLKSLKTPTKQKSKNKRETS